MSTVKSFRFNLSEKEQSEAEKISTECSRQECLEMLKIPINKFPIEGLKYSDKIPKRQALNDFEVITNILKSKAISDGVKYDSDLGERYKLLSKIAFGSSNDFSEKYYDLFTESFKAMRDGLLDIETAERYTLNRCEEYMRDQLEEIGYEIQHSDCRKMKECLWLGKGEEYSILVGCGLFGFEDTFNFKVKHQENVMYGRTFFVDGLTSFVFIFPSIKDLMPKKMSFEYNVNLFSSSIVDYAKNKKYEEMEKALEAMKRQEEKIRVINRYEEIHTAVFHYLKYLQRSKE